MGGYKDGLLSPDALNPVEWPAAELRILVLGLEGSSPKLKGRTLMPRYHVARAHMFFSSQGLANENQPQLPKQIFGPKSSLFMLIAMPRCHATTPKRGDAVSPRMEQ